MNTKTPLLALALVVLVGCQSAPSPTATPAPTPGATPGPPAPSGATGLVADLVTGGANAKLGSFFLSEPIGGTGVSVCVGAETVQVYEFIDHEAALAASVKIDRDDPSHVGNGIVEWNGAPRFWLRDRVIVLYLGKAEATDAALRALLGQPFAESREPGLGLLPTPPCV
ncbi:MAG: hypothetical protein ABIZ52_02675 [Candidatus Limnocylindrales bacterium]